MPKGRRLDEELVARGFFATRGEALRSIMAGEVSTAGRRLESAGERVAADTVIHLRGRSAYVSRGGLKLERGLEALGVGPTGKACLDVGCSTGGFTDCLLRHGAASVLAVDVGYAQFDWSLRQDPRVELLERTNIVDVPSPKRAGTIDLAVCDVSFTSIRTILPAVMELLMEEGLLLALVKPQFEAGRSEVGKGGVVSDPVVQLRALKKVAGAFCEAGLVPVAACPSPICGHKGNREFLLLGARTSSQGAHVPQCGRPHQEASAPVALDLKALVYDDACVSVVDVHACPAELGARERGLPGQVAV